MLSATSLIFEYINGFHDSANAIATVVSTKVLTARAAILYAGVLNIAGAFMGTHVASTIGKGIVATESVTQGVILCALLAAIIWNLITWYYGIPSSSSHALIGGLIGASIAKAGYHVVHFEGVARKVLLPMVTSPLIGFAFGFLCMLSILWICARANPNSVNKYFKKLQLVSSGIMALSHGSNDAQKTMGIITLALVSYHALPTFEVPYWGHSGLRGDHGNGHHGRRLADYPHHGQQDDQTQTGAWIRRRNLGRGRDPQRLVFRHPGQHHPHYLHLDHGGLAAPGESTP